MFRAPVTDDVYAGTTAFATLLHHVNSTIADVEGLHMVADFHRMESLVRAGG